MNEFLADIYNTRESIGAPQDSSDVEKLAEAQLLDEALKAEGVDIDKLSGETILKLAHQLLGDDSALVKAAAEEGEKKEEAKEEAEEEDEEKKEPFEEKVAQADFLGRVMAHSYWNEKVGIEKEAAMPAALKAGLERAGAFGKSVGSKAKELGSKAKELGAKAWKHTGSAVGEKAKAMKGSYEGAREGLIPGTLRHAVTGGKGRLGAALEVAKQHPKTVAGLAAGLAAAGGGGAYLATKKKKASAIDLLAEKRAMEWAEAHGLVNEESTDEMKLAAAVDQRAAEMLAEAGIDVNAVEASVQE